MPFLKAPDGETHELYRPLSVVGTGAGCDLQLPAVDGIAAGHFQLLAEAGTHRLLARASTRVNGAKIKETLLGDGDRIEIGPLQLTYHMEQPKEAEPHQPVDHRDLERLLEFARSIQTGASPTMLLDTLLEHCVALAEADSGDIVLLEADGGAKVAARSGQAQTTAEPVLLSDTLLKEVQGRRHPLLIADVMDHTLFAQAQSVIDLRLKAAIGLPFVLVRDRHPSRCSVLAPSRLRSARGRQPSGAGGATRPARGRPIGTYDRQLARHGESL